MKYSEAGLGRIFVMRLEDGEILHDEIESFAAKKSINSAAVIALGGADKDSKLIVGPREGRNEAIEPMEALLDGVHEIAGVGTIFPNEQDKPTLHMHAACGREKSTVTGCVRAGVKTWHIMEVIILELTGTDAKRKFEESTGFSLLNP